MNIKGKGPSRTNPQLGLIPIAVAAALLSTIYSPNAAAEDCTGTPFSITCSGDQSAGVDGLLPALGSPNILFATELTVNNLTSDITGMPLLPYAAPYSPMPSAVNLNRFGMQGDSGGTAPILGGDGDNGTNGPGVTLKFLDDDYAITPGANGGGISVTSQAGSGGDGGDGIGGIVGPCPLCTFVPGFGGNGGDGGSGGEVKVTNLSSIFSEAGRGIFAASVAGNGGNGGLAIVAGSGGDGGAGGAGGDVSVSNQGLINTFASAGHAIEAKSVGGSGGSGGDSFGIISIGGEGKSSGEGGRVEVFNQANLTTSGAFSSGIYSTSIEGGESAEGGTTGGLISIGGGGGNAGHANQTTIKNSGGISTTGENSSAVLAQSIGGSGGNGGGAVSGLQTVTLSLGGSGGAGGDGGVVSYEQQSGGNNVNALETQGNFSHGIQAQSLGGGGGNGGYAISVSTGKKVSAAIAIGGSGGAGGDGNKVEIYNESAPSNLASENRIDTSGANSHAIFAQSVGGGGGNGGFAIAAAISDGASATFSMGGSGGGGGNGDQVDIENHRSLNAEGLMSSAIVAQSIGGGGGDGGFSISGGIAKQGSVAVSLGGRGGDGGVGGVVNVEQHTGQVVTSGESASAIIAQSIGGGGGNGGFSVSGVLGGKDSKNVAVSVGGFGGVGGVAQKVTVNNTSEIQTQGGASHGLVAQSIGGGGGNGGGSVSGIVGLTSANKEGFNLNVAVSVGGFGGSGAIGGQVEVNNAGNIQTQGMSSHAIYAQSIGGGGGDGGFSFSGLGSFGTGNNGNKSPNSAINVSTSIGGFGGLAGIANTVDILNDGELNTQGTGSMGILAQSIGGGGGNGGNANALSLTVVTAGGGSSKNVNANIAVGGFGGAANHGNRVDVENTNAITTNGSGGHGIAAQSIGGGGGMGGNGELGSGNTYVDAALAVGSAPVSNVKAYQTLNVILGGQGGASGNGNIVSVHNSGDIRTNSVEDPELLASGGVEASYGILAQSIGGGGGIAGNTSGGTFNPGVSLALGGGSSGNGDLVEVVNEGSIVTKGMGSTAILAQSIGGGGGAAGNVSRLPIVELGLNAAISIGGGDGGNGGNVEIDNDGLIDTAGDFANGIFAQSVGGGGGIAGDVGLDISGGLFAGSVGQVGNAGRVNINSAGTINTAGESAHAIFAQSASGQGAPEGSDAPSRAGNININISGDLNASGENSNAVHAQSRGSLGVGGRLSGQNVGNTNGNININIGRDATLTTNSDAATIAIHDGRSNKVTNRGQIISLNYDYAITGTVGYDTIDNHGLIQGSIDLNRQSIDGVYLAYDLFPDSRANTFSNDIENKQTGTILTGVEMILGNDGVLRNFGELSIGDIGATQQTFLEGNLKLESLSSFFFDINFDTGLFDILSISNGATLAGLLEFNFMGNSLQEGQYDFLYYDSLVGEFESVFFPSIAGYGFNVIYGDNYASLIVQAVPEPATWLMFSAGFGFLWARKRSSKTKVS